MDAQADLSLRWTHMPFCWFCHEAAHVVLCLKDADRMANSVDTDQTAPKEAVWSGSTLFAQTCLSENLEPLQ